MWGSDLAGDLPGSWDQLALISRRSSKLSLRSCLQPRGVSCAAGVPRTLAPWMFTTAFQLLSEKEPSRGPRLLIVEEVNMKKASGCF